MRRSFSSWSCTFNRASCKQTYSDLSDDCPATATFRRLPSDFPATFQWLPSDFPATFRRSSGDWRVSGALVMLRPFFQRLSSDCPATFSDFLASFQRMSIDVSAAAMFQCFFRLGSGGPLLMAIAQDAICPVCEKTLKPSEYHRGIYKYHRVCYLARR